MHDDLVKRLRSQCRGYGKECEDCNADGNCRSQMENEAADAIEELQKPKWISVEERLPEDRQSVLVHRDDGGIFIFEYFTTSPTDECWIDDHLNVYSAYCVTHWMPLPEAPNCGAKMEEQE